MKKKIYENKDGLKFTLNDDLTNDEAIEAQELLKTLTVIKPNAVELRQTQEEHNRLLGIALVPEEPLPIGFSYGSFRASVDAEIISDFFLAIIASWQNMVSSTKRSTLQLQKRLKNMRP